MIYWLDIIKKYIFRSKPLALNYFVTSSCNGRCRHCFYDTNTDGPKELDISEIERFAKSLDSLLYLNITGGEPFMRKDLIEIADIFYRYTAPRKITVTTNGFFMEEAVRFAAAAVRFNDTIVELNISIDALDAAHDAIRGVDGIFEKAIDTYKKIRESGISSNSNSSSNVRVGFILTFMRSNADSLEKTIEYLAGLNPDFISLNLVRGEVSDPDEKFFAETIDFKKFESYLDKIKSIGGRQSVGFIDNLRRSKTDLILDYRKKIYLADEYTCKCLAGTSIGVLYPDGSLSPCELLGDGFGNVRDHEFDIGRLWKSSRAKHFRKTIYDSKCRCTHECFLTASTAFSPRQLFKIFRMSVKKRGSTYGQ
jgi:MoaA/NifB/PqqE/SkfB family radical SAM enzyme